MRLKTLRALCAIAALTFATAHSIAQTSVRIASTAQPGSLLMNFVDEMVDKINKSPAAGLKGERLFIGSEQEMTTQIARGRLEMGNLSFTGVSVLVPEAAVLTMPYLWKSNEERDFVTDNYALPVLKSIFEAKSLVIVGLGEVGWTDVLCKKACLSPADVKGRKVRMAPALTSKMFWNAVGANGIQMPASELFPALQSGLVEAADLPFNYYVTTPAAQTAPHYVMTRHLHQGYTLVINKGVWDKMTPDQQKLIMASRPDTAHFRKEVGDSEKPKMAEFKAKGGFVHELTPAQRAEWAKLVEPHQGKLIAEIGGRAGELWAAIAKGKQDHAAKGGK